MRPDDGDFDVVEYTWNWRVWLAHCDAGAPNLDEALTKCFGDVQCERFNQEASFSAHDFLDFKAPSGQGWGYCVFGKVVEGMDVVDAIRALPTGNKGFHQDVPKESVIIEKAEVLA